MIRIPGRGAVYGELWFDEEHPRDAGIDIALYRQRPAPVPGARTEPFLTLVSDLSDGEDGIFAAFSKNCRYQVTRAERDGLSFRFVAEPGAALGEFRAFYDAFARERHVACSDPQWLEAASAARQLALSCVEREGETLAWHVYVVAGERTHLQYSASCFRDLDSGTRALLGRANRWLHWQNMRRLRELGVKRYDWGGLFEDESAPEHAGINRFKLGFGGRRERTFNCTLPLTLRGRVYLPLRAAWRQLRAA